MKNLTLTQRIILALAIPFAACLLYWFFAAEVFKRDDDLLPVVALVLLGGVTAFEMWLWRRPKY